MSALVQPWRQDFPPRKGSSAETGLTSRKAFSDLNTNVLAPSFLKVVETLHTWVFAPRRPAIIHPPCEHPHRSPSLRRRRAVFWNPTSMLLPLPIGVRSPPPAAHPPPPHHSPGGHSYASYPGTSTSASRPTATARPPRSAISLPYSATPPRPHRHR
jgi:hypothetical protein